MSVSSTRAVDTTAATLQAGLPAVALPMGFDQIVHWRRITELGVGRMVRGKGDRVSAIADALNAISDPAVRAAARDFGRRLVEEDGIGNAADLVERYCWRECNSNGPRSHATSTYRRSQPELERAHPHRPLVSHPRLTSAQ